MLFSVDFSLAFALPPLVRKVVQVRRWYGAVYLTEAFRAMDGEDERYMDAL